MDKIIYYYLTKAAYVKKKKISEYLLGNNIALDALLVMIKSSTK